MAGKFVNVELGIRIILLDSFVELLQELYVTVRKPGQVNSVFLIIYVGVAF